MGIQPLLHDLTCTVTAPLQVWTAASGNADDSGAQGAYLSDRRFLSALTLTSASHSLEVIGADVLDHGRARFVSTVRAPSMAVDPEVRLVRLREVSDRDVTERLEVTNASSRAETVQLTLTLVPDSSSMEDVKQGRRSPTTPVVAPEGSSWEDAHCRTELQTDGRVTVDSGHVVVTWEIDVPAGETRTGTVSLTPTADVVVTPPPGRWLSERGAPLIERAEGNPDLVRLLTRALSDLDGLTLSHCSHPEERFVGAGAPWFLTLFGRDSLITASFLTSIDPKLTLETLRILASLQGTQRQVATAEQPGKILHEVRGEELTLDTTSGRITLPPVYYGTIDATPLWISTLHDAWRAGAPEDEIRELLPNLRAALAWMRDHGDADGDGFLEYLDETGSGLANQGWKDSGDSVRWHDGSLAEGPIALCEVQGYAHRAALDGAALLEAFGEDGAALRLWAHQLRTRFREQFWVERGGRRYPAIALDAEKRPVDSLTSNIGHLLGTGILDDAEVDLVIEALLSPEMFSGYGIRTASTTNGGYWPLRYHVGSVWPHDTAMIIRGMRREGHLDAARTVAEGLLEAGRQFEWRLPELFSGAPRDALSRPLPYPASCRPQAWAAAAAVVVADALVAPAATAE